MRFHTLLSAVLLFSMLGACGAPGPIIEYPVLNELPQVRDGAALVYFFYPNNRHDPRYSRYFFIFDDHGDAESFLGAVTEGSFFFVNFVPGTHNFSCLEINLEAGQTYYLSVRNSQTVNDLISKDTIRDPRVRFDKKRFMRSAPIDLCPPSFVALTPEYAQPIIAELTYTVVKKE